MHGSQQPLAADRNAAVCAACKHGAQRCVQRILCSHLTDMGPSPGAPCPPRMHVGTHFFVHCCTCLPLGPSISAPSRGAVLLSLLSRPCLEWKKVAFRCRVSAHSAAARKGVRAAHSLVAVHSCRQPAQKCAACVHLHSSPPVALSQNTAPRPLPRPPAARSVSRSRCPPPWMAAAAPAQERHGGRGLQLAGSRLDTPYNANSLHNKPAKWTAHQLQGCQHLHSREQHGREWSGSAAAAAATAAPAAPGRTGECPPVRHCYSAAAIRLAACWRLWLARLHGSSAGCRCEGPHGCCGSDRQTSQWCKCTGWHVAPIAVAGGPLHGGWLVACGCCACRALADKHD